MLVSDEANVLAREYVKAGVIGQASYADAEHIATATIARADVLVSWNFRHILNLDRIHGYNSVNVRLGHALIEIRSPREIGDDKGNTEEEGI